MKEVTLELGLLFNDFLLLATPDEGTTVADPEAFKLSRSVEGTWTIYKLPLLLHQLRLLPKDTMPGEVHRSYG